MKLTHFIAAGLVLAGVGMSTEASAQRYGGYGSYGYSNYGYDNYRGDRHYRGDRWDDRRWDKRDKRRWNKRWNRGHHYGWRNNRGDCRVVYRYGQRYRICR